MVQLGKMESYELLGKMLDQSARWVSTLVKPGFEELFRPLAYRRVEGSAEGETEEEGIAPCREKAPRKKIIQYGEVLLELRARGS